MAAQRCRSTSEASERYVRVRSCDMKRRVIIPWLVAATSVVVSIALIAAVGLTADFVRNLVGTFVGASLGLLVALYLDRIERDRADELRRREQAEEDARLRARDAAAEKRESERRAQIARDRKVAVLSLLREELGLVPDQMGQRQHRGQAPFDRMADIIWRAFSSSGELRWIDDIKLLRTIASAYDLVAVEIALESRWSELRLDPTTAPEAERAIGNQLRRYDHDTWRRACEACKAMDAALIAEGAPAGANADKLFCP